jgi:hypothetical protein
MTPGEQYQRVLPPLRRDLLARIQFPRMLYAL